MGFKDQFIDVIEFVDDYENVIVKKYERPFSDDNEIKTGAKVIVRESQRAVFIKGGQLADVFTPGTYKLSTENIPILSTILALPYMFNSPIKADLYFISLKQFIGNMWETKSPIIVRDKEFNMVRISASGTFAFRITEPDVFMREVLGTQKMYMMQQIVEYLSSYILEVFGVTIGECNIPVIDLPIKYSVISSSIVNKANEKTRMNGIEITNVNVEAIKLPPQVEQYIDEQSGIGMASKHMDEFVQYQSARAIRDVASQSGGLAGLGASMVVGKQIAETMQGESNVSPTVEEKIEIPPREMNEKITSLADEILKYKKLMDDGILTKEEFEEMKERILNS